MESIVIDKGVYFIQLYGLTAVITLAVGIAVFVIFSLMRKNLLEGFDRLSYNYTYIKSEMAYWMRNLIFVYGVAFLVLLALYIIKVA